MTTATTLQASYIGITTPTQSGQTKSLSLKEMPLDLGKATLKTAGRVADGVDGLIDIPKNVGEFIARYTSPIPGVGLVAQNTGLLVSGLTKFAVHCSTFGTLRWLSGLRRKIIVGDVVRDSIGKKSDLGTMTVTGFISSIRSPELRKQFSNYLELVRTKADPHKLLKIELSLGRNADFQELQTLAGLSGEMSQVSQARLAQIAEDVASRMIARIDETMAGKGTLTGLLPGSWSYLAVQGEAGKAALVSKIKEQLLGAYLKERENVSSGREFQSLKTDLADKFLVNATMREAGFYTVAGVLIKTGLLGVALKELPNVLHQVGSFLSNYLPDWVTGYLSELYGATKAAVLSVAGLFGAKIAYDTTKMFGGDKAKTDLHTSDGGKVVADLHQRLNADMRTPVDGGASNHLNNGLRIDGGDAHLEIGKGPVHVGGDTATRVGDVTENARLHVETRPATR